MLDTTERPGWRHQRLFLSTKHNRKYRRAVKAGIVKDGFRVKDENVVEVKQIPKTMESRRPPQELDGLQIRGKKDSENPLCTHHGLFLPEQGPKGADHDSKATLEADCHVCS